MLTTRRISHTVRTVWGSATCELGHNLTVTATDDDAADERLTASSHESTGDIKLECSDGRRVEVIGAEWTGRPIAPSTDIHISDTPRETCNGTDERTFELSKQLCNGQ